MKDEVRKGTAKKLGQTVHNPEAETELQDSAHEWR